MQNPITVGNLKFTSSQEAQDFFGKTLFDLPPDIPFAGNRKKHSITALDRTTMLALFKMHPKTKELTKSKLPMHFEIRHELISGIRGYCAIYEFGSDVLFCYQDCLIDRAAATEFDKIYENVVPYPQGCLDSLAR
jgi:hypothetical protein